MIGHAIQSGGRSEEQCFAQHNRHGGRNLPQILIAAEQGKERSAFDGAVQSREVLGIQGSQGDPGLAGSEAEGLDPRALRRSACEI